MDLLAELKERADRLDAEMLALSARMKEIDSESVQVHMCINTLDLAEMDAEDAALSPAPEPESAGEVEIPDALAEFMQRPGAVKWEGGETCPIPACADVEILWCHGRVDPINADSYWSDGVMWQHHGEGDDIIAYRILSEPATEAERTGSESLTTGDDRVEPQASVEADQVTQANAAIAQTTDELAAEPPHNFDADVFAAGIEAEAEPKHKFSIFGIRYKLPTEKEPA